MSNITISKLKNISKNISRKKIIIISIIVIIVLGGYFIFRRKSPVYQFIPVTMGPITETVSVTGNTTPTSSVSLGFGNSGTVSNIYSSVGKNVSTGQVLAELNTSDLQAQINQAQANIDTQQANYDKVVNGATSYDIDVAKSAVTSAETALTQAKMQQDTLVKNAYKNLLSSGLVAIPQGISSTETPPTISGAYSKNTEGQILINIYQGGNGEYFSTSGLVNSTGSVDSSTAQPIGDSGLYIKFASSSSQTNWVVNIPNKQSSVYITNYNAYQSALSTQMQTVANAQAALDQAQSALTLKQSAARPEDIAVAQAGVDSAKAALQSIQAKVQNSKIIAPISGLITQFDAKVGQFAQTGTNLVSIISRSSFEVDALVSETDIGKVSVGNKVDMTLDAFPGETLYGSVFYIDQAQTTNQGVIGYKIKVSFDKSDPRMKSGLTANLNIETRHKDSTLILPQYAILQNDQGTFVEVLENGKVKNIPVTLGLQDQSGNVEILSGVTKDENVLNIGLK